MTRASSADHPDRLFHHPDAVPTPVHEWLFILLMVLVVLVGLPLILGAMFHFLVPWMGKLLVH
jgi:hypothetical protein